MKSFYILIVFTCFSHLVIGQEEVKPPNQKLENLNDAFKKYVKYDKGITFVQKDSLFSASFQFRMQNRAAYYSTSERDFTPESFELRTRRLRMKLKGFVYSPKLTYYVQLSFSRGDMDWDGTQNSSVNSSPNVIRDAIINYHISKSFTLGLGQTKLPGNRQRVISSGDQQFVDRSIVNANFTLDRDFGLFATWNKKYIILKGAISSGEGRNSNKSNKGLSYTGRVEILPFGKFTGNNDYIEGDLAREPKPKLSIAGAYNYNAQASRKGGQLGYDLYQYVNMQSFYFDMVFKYKGFAISNEFSSRIADKPITVSNNNIRNVYTGYGNLIQISYLFRNNYEIAIRQAFISPFKSVYDNPAYPNLNELREEHYHLGVSKYIYGHRVKVQANLVYQIKKDLKNVSQMKQFGAIFQVEVGF